MKHKVLTMLAAAVLLLATTSCSKDDNTINVAELEKELVGVWWDEFEYADVTETGVPFTRVLLAIVADADHTGCIYLGVFDDTDDLPLAVYGGPEDAGFRWQLLSDGSVELRDPLSGDHVKLIRTRVDASSYGENMTDVASTNMSYAGEAVKVANGSYTGTLTRADEAKRAEIEKIFAERINGTGTNLNGEDDLGINPTPGGEGFWGR